MRWSVGGGAEEVGEQRTALGGGADLQVEDGAVEVETEVEERAAPLLRGGQLGDAYDPVGGQGQPQALGRLGA
ncbi:hypothetical protein [Streptomyces cinereoruber]|uniref:hypothetical protein n=1 Tax=Streptomyces cinereoruber TaxID=67260 RepID=UPI00363BF5A0